MSAPRCVACGAPPWFGELSIHGTAAWAVDRLADLGVPADRAHRAVIEQGSATMAVAGEVVAAFNPREVNRWHVVLCVDHWPDGDQWADVAGLNRHDHIELFQLGSELA